MSLQGGVSMAASNTDSIKPPVAATSQWEEVRHGETVTDPYRWLHKKEDPKVIDYLKAENAYTDAMTAHVKPLADKLFQETRARMKETDLSVPVRRGNYYYYNRFEAGKQYPFFCRRPAAANGQDDVNAKEEIMLDGNALAEGQKFMGMGGTKISPDANLIAYWVDYTGYRQFRLQVKDLRSGKVLNDSVERVTSVAWAADNQTLFYTQEDPVTKRSDRLFRLKLGSQPEQVYYEPVEQFALEVGTTKDRAFVIVHAQSTDTTEDWAIPADKPTAAMRSVLGRQTGHRYDTDSHNGQFLIRTNRNARNFRLVSAPVATPDEAHWTTIAEHQNDGLITGFEVFEHYLAVAEKSQALNRIRIYDFAKKSWKTIAFDDQVYLAMNTGTPEYRSGTMRINYQSPVTPSTVMEVDLASGQRKVLKQQEVLGGYDASRYEARRIWVTARDGARVPAWAVMKKGVELNGKAPLLLYAYGSYGISMEPSFSLARLSLLDRGVIYVQAHIRGGTEMGEHWHDDGMLMKKKNTFNDFIDVAEYLTKNGWTSRDRLIIEGGSAGGLLMGAVTNMRPDLFKAVHAAVPFVDVMNTMMDASLPLTTGEYLEWGNPNDKAAYDYMRSYSPYDNLEKKAYPAMLVTTGLNDSQVMYWEPAKYVAKLRTLKTDNNPLLLKMNMDAGHGGASGRYDALKETAFNFAWMLDQWGIKE